MNNTNTENRIKELNETLESLNYSYTYKETIKQLLNENKIDNIISKITDEVTIPDVTTIIKKDSLSGNEQFLIMLNSFIDYFKRDFYFINKDTTYIISTLLYDANYCDYLLCKYYIGNNNYIPFFRKSYLKLVIHGFYSNLQKLSSDSEVINKFITENDIDISKSLDSQEDIYEKLFLLLQKITLSNIKESNITILFESIDDYYKHVISKKSYSIEKLNSLKESTFDFYILQWERMIKEYNNKVDAINIIFY